MSPIYLQELVQIYIPPRKLRSSDKNNLVEPRSKFAFNNKTFSIYASALWNKLSINTRNSPDQAIFKSRLKTELFEKAFGR